MVGAEETPAVVLLTRAPSSGGKSRLFASLGTPPDPALLSALLLDTLDGIADPAWQRIVAVTPPDACEEIRALVPADVHVIAQPSGTLGARMRALMEAAIDPAREGRLRPVAVIGSDLPAMTPRRIGEAFAALARTPDALVIGPAVDGGYYLIAAARVPEVFADIDWGTPAVLEQTCAAAGRLRLQVQLLDAMADVDTMDDLRRLPVSARRTRAWAQATGLVGSS